MLYKFIIFIWDKARSIEHKLRSIFWYFILPNKPYGLRVFGSIHIERPYNLLLGKNVKLNHGCYLNARGKIIIGDECHLSPYVMINAGQLDLAKSKRPHIIKEVKIGNNVWIATNVIINPGVSIGDGCVIGAGAVVTRDLPSNTLCVGIPAVPIKQLNTR